MVEFDLDGTLKGFNWVYLLVYIVEVFIVLFLLFFVNRVAASILSYFLRFYTWRNYNYYIDLDSIQISLLAGRILFKNLRLYGPNETITIVAGHITWRYWFRTVLHNDYVEGKGSKAKLPCRIFCHIKGLEWFIYNRTAAFESLLKQTNDSNCSVNVRQVVDGNLDGRLPSYFPVPIEISCRKGAIVVGNQTTPRLLIAKYQRAIAVIYKTKPKNHLDDYRATFNISIYSSTVRLRSNVDYINTKQHAYSRNLSPNLNSYEPSSLEGFFPTHWRIFLKTTFPSKANLNNNEWMGLSRYLDADQEKLPDSDNKNYARVNTLFDAKAANIVYYYDVPRDVNASGFGNCLCEQNCIYDSDIDAPLPEWGIDVKISAATIHYGPWADRQRTHLQNMLFPRYFYDATADAVHFSRKASVLKIFIEVDEEIIFQIPTREQSKNWQYEKNKNRLKVRPYGWIEIKSGPLSSVSFSVDMSHKKDGWHRIMTADLRDTRINTSINHGLMLNCSKSSIRCDFVSPIKWRNLTRWCFIIEVTNLHFYLLTDHVTLLSDLIGDWSSGPIQNYHTFVPFVYTFQLKLSEFELNCNVNDGNIISNPSQLADNIFVIFKGPVGSIALEVSADKIQPMFKVIPFTISIPSTTMVINNTIWSTLSSFIESPNYGSMDDLLLKGEYIFATSSEHTDETLFLDVMMSDPKIQVYGFVIRYLMNLKNNYFGGRVHFVTLEELQDKLRNFPTPSVSENQTSQYQKVFQTDNNEMKSNPLDLHLSLNVQRGGIYLPINLYNSAELILLKFSSLCIDARFSEFYTGLYSYLPSQLLMPDFQCNLSPIACSIVDGISLLFTTHIAHINGLRLYSHRFLGNPPDNPPYCCNWDARIDTFNVSCQIMDFKKIVRAGESFIYHFIDKENALSDFAPPEVEVTFLRLDIGTIDVSVIFGDQNITFSSQSLQYRRSDLTDLRRSSQDIFIFDNILLSMTEHGIIQLIWRFDLTMTVIHRKTDIFAHASTQTRNMIVHDAKYGRFTMLTKTGNILPEEELCLPYLPNMDTILDIGLHAEEKDRAPANNSSSVNSSVHSSVSFSSENHSYTPELPKTGLSYAQFVRYITSIDFHQNYVDALIIALQNLPSPQTAIFGHIFSKEPLRLANGISKFANCCHRMATEDDMETIIDTVQKHILQKIINERSLADSSTYVNLTLQNLKVEFDYCAKMADAYSFSSHLSLGTMNFESHELCTKTNGKTHKYYITLETACFTFGCCPNYEESLICNIRDVSFRNHLRSVIIDIESCELITQDFPPINSITSTIVELINDIKGLKMCKTYNEIYRERKICMLANLLALGSDKCVQEPQFLTRPSLLLRISENLLRSHPIWRIIVRSRYHLLKRKDNKCMIFDLFGNTNVLKNELESFLSQSSELLEDSMLNRSKTFDDVKSLSIIIVSTSVKLTIHSSNSTIKVLRWTCNLTFPQNMQEIPKCQLHVDDFASKHSQPNKHTCACNMSFAEFDISLKSTLLDLQNYVTKSFNNIELLYKLFFSPVPILERPTRPKFTYIIVKFVQINAKLETPHSCILCLSQKFRFVQHYWNGVENQCDNIKSPDILCFHYITFADFRIIVSAYNDFGIQELISMNILKTTLSMASMKQAKLSEKKIGCKSYGLINIKELMVIMASSVDSIIDHVDRVNRDLRHISCTHATSNPYDTLFSLTNFETAVFIRRIAFQIKFESISEIKIQLFRFKFIIHRTNMHVLFSARLSENQAIFSNSPAKFDQFKLPLPPLSFQITFRIVNNITILTQIISLVDAYTIDIFSLIYLKCIFSKLSFKSEVRKILKSKIFLKNKRSSSEIASDKRINMEIFLVNVGSTILFFREKQLTGKLTAKSASFSYKKPNQENAEVVSPPFGSVLATVISTTFSAVKNEHVIPGGLLFTCRLKGAEGIADGFSLEMPCFDFYMTPSLSKAMIELANALHMKVKSNLKFCFFSDAPKMNDNEGLLDILLPVTINAKDCSMSRKKYLRSFKLENFVFRLSSFSKAIAANFYRNVYIDDSGAQMVFSLESLILSNHRLKKSANIKLINVAMELRTDMDFCQLGERYRSVSRNCAIFPKMVFDLQYAIDETNWNFYLNARGDLLEISVDSDVVKLIVSLTNCVLNIKNQIKELVCTSDLINSIRSSDMPTKSALTKRFVQKIVIRVKFLGAEVGIYNTSQRRKFDYLTPNTPQSMSFGMPHVGELSLPGVSLKSVYSCSNDLKRALISEIIIQEAENVLTPIVMPMIRGVIDSVTEEVHRSNANKSGSSQLKTLDSIEASTKVFKNYRVGLSLKIESQSISLDCQPTARIAAFASMKGLSLTFATTPRDDNTTYLSLNGAVDDFAIYLQHIYSREYSVRFTFKCLRLSCINNHQYGSNEAGLSATASLKGLYGLLDVKQIQDLLLFKTIWLNDLPIESKASTSSTILSGLGNQKIKEVHTTGSSRNQRFSLNIVASVSSVQCAIDFGAFIGKCNIAIDKVWLTNQKSKNHCTSMLLHLHKIDTVFSGHLSGLINFEEIKIHKFLCMDEKMVSDMPLFQFNGNLTSWQVRLYFDYQLFLLSNLNCIYATLYNRHSQKAFSDIVFEGHNEVFRVGITAAGPSYMFTLYQSLRRLMTEKFDLHNTVLRHRDIGRSNIHTPSHTPKFYLQFPNFTSGAIYDQPSTQKIRKTSVTFNVNNMVMGLFKISFEDDKVLRNSVESLKIRFTQIKEETKVQDVLNLSLQKFNSALPFWKATYYKDDVQYLKFWNEQLLSTKGGIILSIPQMQASMLVRQANMSFMVKYEFQSDFGERVDVGLNLGSLEYVRQIYNTYKLSLKNDLQNQPRNFQNSSSDVGTGSGQKPAIGSNPIKLANIPIHSGYIYIELTPPIIETPQLRAMGDATPPLEWFGVNRSRLPGFTHQVIIIPLQHLANIFENIYATVLNSNNFNRDFGM